MRLPPASRARLRDRGPTYFTRAGRASAEGDVTERDLRLTATAGPGDAERPDIRRARAGQDEDLAGG